MQQGAGGAGPGRRRRRRQRAARVARRRGARPVRAGRRRTPVPTPTTLPPIAPPPPTVAPKVEPPKPVRCRRRRRPCPSRSRRHRRPRRRSQVASSSPGTAVAAGTDGTAGAGPGSGGGVGAGVGTGRGSGDRARAPAAAARRTIRPSPIEFFLPPLPAPSSVRGLHFIAEFDVDSTGRVLDFEFTPTRDGGYNRRIARCFASMRFRPGTRPDGSPLRMKAQVGYEFYARQPLARGAQRGPRSRGSSEHSEAALYILRDSATKTPTAARRRRLLAFSAPA